MMHSRVTRWRRAPVLLAILVVVPVLAAGLPAQSAAPDGGRLTLEAVAPQDLFAFVSVAGLEESSRAAERLGLFRLWKEPEVQRLFGKFIEAYESAASGAPPEMIQQWEMAKSFLAGRLAAIAGGITVIWTRDGPVPVPGLVVALDLGDRREAFQQMLEGALASDEMKREMRGVVRSTITYRDQEILVLSQERYYPQLSLCGTYLENLFLVGLNQPLLKKCIDVHRDGGAKALRRLPSFQRARSKAESGALVEAFLNVDAFTARLRGLVPDEWLGLLHGLGLDGLNAVYYASAAHDGDSFDTFYLDAPAPRRGLLAASTGSVNEATLKLVPRNAAYFEAFRVDLGRIYDVVWQGLETVLPPRELGKVSRGLERLERRLGFKIREGMLAALGEEGVAYSELPENGLIPSLVIAMEVRDRAKAEQVLTALLGLGKVECRAVPFGEHTMHVINPPGKTPFSPAYAFVGDRLVFSLFAAGLKGAIQRHGESVDSVLDSPDFAAALKGLPWKRGSVVAYLDVKRFAAYWYNLAESILPGLLADESIPLDPALMPPADVFLKHVNGWGEVIYGDQDGIVLKARTTSLATVLGLLGRFIDRAPGFPPYALERMGRMVERRMRGVEVRGVPGMPGTTRIRPTGEAVNPLPPGDPQEAVQKARLEALEKAIARTPDNGSLQYQRAQVLHLLRRFEESATGFERAFGLGVNESVSAYNAACCWSLAGKPDPAIKWLETAFRNGFENWTLVESDSDLNSLRKDPRFEPLVARYRGL
jgi:tetratricopeptide (TPR) repeat protein